MLAAIAVVLFLAEPAEPSTRPESAPTRAGPRDLTVEFVQDSPDHAALDARFRLASGKPGVLRFDFWSGATPSVESEFSIDGTPHVWLRQIEGEDPESRLSSDIENDPSMMSVYWSVMTNLSLYRPIEGNPLCGGTKWGLKILTWLATSACCTAGGVTACLVVCKSGGDAAHDAINRIDCSKECKPDCPIP